MRVWLVFDLGVVGFAFMSIPSFDMKVLIGRSPWKGGRDRRHIGR